MRINWRGVVNLVGSAAGWFVVAFLASWTSTGLGLPMKQAAGVAAGVGVAAVANHLRQSPDLIKSLIDPPKVT